MSNTFLNNFINGSDRHGVFVRRFTIRCIIIRAREGSHNKFSTGKKKYIQEFITNIHVTLVIT